MDRKVPSATSEEIQLFRSTLYSLLRSTGEVQLRALEGIHAGMNSLLHPDANAPQPDPSAFIYALLRLPDCISQVRLIVLGQSSEVFNRHGFEAVESWEPAPARARRRRCLFDGKETLACFIASRSDIEDVIPALTAYQIEWNKLHYLLRRWPKDQRLEAALQDPAAEAALEATLKMPHDDLERLKSAWGAAFLPNLKEIAARKCGFSVRLLSGSLNEYRRATHDWWVGIAREHPEIEQRPVYFVSSNTHSIPNTLTGFALRRRDQLKTFLRRPENASLLAEWETIERGAVPSRPENFWYYILKKAQSAPGGAELLAGQQMAEQTHGIARIPSEHTFDVEAQIIDLARLDPAELDPRLRMEGLDLLRRSDALILNIDYPLGQAAYNLLTKTAEQASAVLGVYVMGKAATLNGVRGDMMIPNVVQDEHSHNTYLFENCFSANDLAPHLVYGAVLDNQKALTVLGTFLQNRQIMDIFYQEGYADIEMEAGPYLSAVYEMFRPKRHPIDEIVNLYGLSFDLGVLHYASDTPLSKAHNLGAGTLSYFGMDSTYAATVAILRRIFTQEIARLR